MNTLYYETKGAGKRIIFIHGNSQNVKVWDSIIKSSEIHEYTLTTVDLPGHGNSFHSQTPEVDYTLKGLAKHLKFFVSQYDNEPFVFIGSSLGGNVIAEIDPFPENCVGVFLTGTTIVGENYTVSDILKANLGSAALYMKSVSDAEKNDLANLLMHDATLEAKNLYLKAYDETDPSFRAHLAAAIARQNWSDEIKRLKMAKIPVAIIYGDNDLLVNSSYLYNSQLNKWREEIIIIPDAGHAVEYDQPKKVANLIKEFVADCFK